MRMISNIGAETADSEQRARSYFNWQLSTPKPETNDATPRGPVAIGLDLGFSIDYSAAVAVERTPAGIYTVRKIEKWPLRTPYQTVIERTVEIYRRLRDKGHSCIILLDIGGVGRGVYEMLSDKNVSAYGVQLVGSGTTHINGGVISIVKSDMASTLNILSNPNNARLRIPMAARYARELKTELRNYEIHVSDGGAATFGAFAHKSHDDIVSALGYALIYFERFGGGVRRRGVTWI